jgi:adenine deaminase
MRAANRCGLLVLLLVGQAALPAQQYDLIVRGGRLLDGTGNPWRLADVAVTGDRIPLSAICRAQPPGA